MIGNERKNRLYAGQIMSPEHREDLFSKIQSFAEQKKNNSIERIVETVESDILAKEKFIRLKGIKHNLNAYKGLVNPLCVYRVRIK
jgi:23S rRNA maturation-related 3'-5' exoribonuclease YhaM